MSRRILDGGRGETGCKYIRANITRGEIKIKITFNLFFSYNKYCFVFSINP